jgi:hypothetical protein
LHAQAERRRDQQTHLDLHAPHPIAAPKPAA